MENHSHEQIAVWCVRFIMALQFAARASEKRRKPTRHGSSHPRRFGVIVDLKCPAIRPDHVAEEA